MVQSELKSFHTQTEVWLCAVYGYEKRKIKEMTWNFTSSLFAVKLNEQFLLQHSIHHFFMDLEASFLSTVTSEDT